MTVSPTALSPAFMQYGVSPQSFAGCFFIPNIDLPGITLLPKVVNAGATVTTAPIRVVGFNMFALMIECDQPINVSLTHLHPITQAELTTHVIGPAVPGNLIYMSYGYVIASSNAVFNTIALKFVNTGGVAANIAQFPGLWAGVR